MCYTISNFSIIAIFIYWRTFYHPKELMEKFLIGRRRKNRSRNLIIDKSEKVIFTSKEIEEF